MARTMGAGCLLWESELEVLPLNVDGNIEKSKVVLCKFHAIKPCERVSVSHYKEISKRWRLLPGKSLALLCNFEEKT